MARILVLCPHPEHLSPGQRLKFEQYYPSWRAAGFEVDVRPFWDERTARLLYRRGHTLEKLSGLVNALLRRVHDTADARRADLVYLFLEAVPFGPAVLEKLIRESGVPIVYDIDDLVYVPHASRANPFMRWARNYSKFPALMREARQVIVCTDYLKSFALEQNANVTTVSSTIDTDVYLPRPHRDRTKRVVVGWSGSVHTAPYLSLLADVLRELQRTDDIEVKVIGDASFRIPGLRLRAEDWNLASEVRSLSEIDVGVYPLPDELWVLGKSGLKALQYMALEIPTVATDVGTNRSIIGDGRNGFLVRTHEEWVRVLRRLIRDPALRRAVGTEGRKTVVERYSVRVTEPVYLSILRRALGEA